MIEKNNAEKKEFLLVKEKIKEKKADWIGRWLKKFSEKGTWNLARYRNEKGDWF